MFGNGEIVMNGGSPLKVDRGRKGVVFSKKAKMYQSKDEARSFVALCRADRLGDTAIVGLIVEDYSI